MAKKKAEKVPSIRKGKQRTPDQVISSEEVRDVSDMPPPEELERLLTEFIDIMGIPPGPQRDQMRNLPPASKWKVIQQFKQHRDSDDDTPEAAIQSLAGDPDSSALKSLRVSLTGKPVTWVARFVDKGGLEALVRAAQRGEMLVTQQAHIDQRQQQIDDEIVLCLKGIMNNRPGLIAVMKNIDVTRCLIRYIKSPNYKTQQTALELLACISIYPPDGHHQVVSALKRFMFIARRNSRFDILIDVFNESVLPRQSNPELGRWLLTLINAVISCNDNIEERVKYRQELNGAGFDRILPQLQKLESSSLNRQIEVYLDNERDDNEEREEVQRMLISQDTQLNPQEICIATFQYLLGTGNDELSQGYVTMLRDMLRLSTNAKGQSACLALIHAARALLGQVNGEDERGFMAMVQTVDSVRGGVQESRMSLSDAGSITRIMGPSAADEQDQHAFQQLRAELDQVREERASIQRQLDSAKKQSNDQRTKITDLEAEIEELKKREATLPAIAIQNTGVPVFVPIDGAIAPSTPQVPQLPTVLPDKLPDKMPAAPNVSPLAEHFAKLAGGAAPRPAVPLEPKKPGEAETASTTEQKGPATQPAAPGAAPSAKTGGSTKWGMHPTAIPPPIMPEPGSICAKGPLPPPAPGTYDEQSGDSGSGGSQSWGMHPSAIAPPIMPEPGSICAKGPLPPPATGTYADSGSSAGGNQSWGMHPSAIAPPIMPEPGSICGKGALPPPATGTYASAGASNTKRAAAGGAGKGRLPAKPNTKPALMTKRVQWDKLDDQTVSATVWAKLGIEDLAVDQDALLKLFGRQERKVEPRRAEAADDKPKVASLLSSDTSRAVAICQNQLRMEPDALVHGLSVGDDQLFALSQLEGLVKLCDDESDPLGSVAQYQGELDKLGKPEQFCMVLNRVPDLRQRLEVWIFRRKFNSFAVEAQPDLDVIRQCFTWMRDSVKFQRLLRQVLSLGNFLNGGSRNGGAYGFKLEALPRLVDTKDCNRQSLLHYIVRLMQQTDRSWAAGEVDDKGKSTGKKAGEGEQPNPYQDREPTQSDQDIDASAELAHTKELFPQLCFVREMAPFQRAKFVSFSGRFQEIQQMNAQFAKMQKTVQSMPREGEGADVFFKRMDEFFRDEETTIARLVKEVGELQALYKSVAVSYAAEVNTDDDAESLVTLMRGFRDQVISAINEVEAERVKAERQAQMALRKAQQAKRTAAIDKASQGRVGRRGHAEQSSLFGSEQNAEASFAALAKGKGEATHGRIEGEAAPAAEEKPSGDETPRGTQSANEAQQGLLDDLLGQLTDGNAFIRRNRGQAARRVVRVAQA